MSHAELIDVFQLTATLVQIANKTGVFPHLQGVFLFIRAANSFFFLERTMSDQVTILVRQNNVVEPNQRRVNTGRLITVI